jgi:hypothetical protein
VTKNAAGRVAGRLQGERTVGSFLARFAGLDGYYSRRAVMFG